MPRFGRRGESGRRLEKPEGHREHGGVFLLVTRVSARSRALQYGRRTSL